MVSLGSSSLTRQSPPQHGCLNRGITDTALGDVTALVRSSERIVVPENRPLEARDRILLALLPLADRAKRMTALTSTAVRLTGSDQNEPLQVGDPGLQRSRPAEDP